MKHYKKVKVPSKIQEELDKITCDFCGNEIIRTNYNAEEAIIKHRTGENYPGGGSGEEKSVDICGACFDTKLIPWIESFGIELQETEWDW